MHRGPKIALLFASIAALLIISLPASAAPNRWDGWKPYEDHYLTTYVKCWHAFQEKCGRNIVDDGLASGNEPTQARVEAGSQTMERWLNPPEPAVASSISSDVAPPAPVTTTVAPTSAGGCPSYMAAEASSPSAVNPSSGATGCWQVLPSTAAAMNSQYNGACADVNSGSCLAAICDSQGNGAWASSGATPCG